MEYSSDNTYHNLSLRPGDIVKFILPRGRVITYTIVMQVAEYDTLQHTRFYAENLMDATNDDIFCALGISIPVGLQKFVLQNGYQSWHPRYYAGYWPYAYSLKELSMLISALLKITHPQDKYEWIDKCVT